MSLSVQLVEDNVLRTVCSAHKEAWPSAPALVGGVSGKQAFQGCFGMTVPYPGNQTQSHILLRGLGRVGKWPLCGAAPTVHSQLALRRTLGCTGVTPLPECHTLSRHGLGHSEVLFFTVVSLGSWETPWP